MTDSERLSPDEIADPLLEQALDLALRARPPADAALGRVRVTVRNQWRVAAGARRPWQRWRVPGLAAGVLLASAGLTAAWVGPIATDDPEWAWVEVLAPDYELDNRRLVDFLEWVARETGHKLEIVDERARRIADTTKLHGSVHGLPPLKALANVMATTSLRFELRNDEIRVTSADGSDAR